MSNMSEREAGGVRSLGEMLSQGMRHPEPAPEPEPAPAPEPEYVRLAERIPAGVKREVYLALGEMGGATQDALAARLNRAPNTIWPRLKELEPAGFVRRTARRARTRSGRTAAVWEVRQGDDTEDDEMTGTGTTEPQDIFVEGVPVADHDMKARPVGVSADAMEALLRCGGMPAVRQALGWNTKFGVTRGAAANRLRNWWNERGSYPMSKHDRMSLAYRSNAGRYKGPPLPPSFSLTGDWRATKEEAIALGMVASNQATPAPALTPPPAPAPAPEPEPAPAPAERPTDDDIGVRVAARLAALEADVAAAEALAEEARAKLAAWKEAMDGVL